MRFNLWRQRSSDQVLSSYLFQKYIENDFEHSRVVTRCRWTSSEDERNSEGYDSDKGTTTTTSWRILLLQTWNVHSTLYWNFSKKKFYNKFINKMNNNTNKHLLSDDHQHKPTREVKWIWWQKKDVHVWEGRGWCTYIVKDKIGKFPLARLLKRHFSTFLQELVRKGDSTAL